MSGMPLLITSRSRARRSSRRRRHLGPQIQVVDLDVVHLGHVHVVAGRIQVVGIVGPAQEAGRAALAHHVALLQRPRQHHERQHRHGGRLEPHDVRAERREILGRRRLELARRADLVGRVAGVHLVDGGRVVEQPDRRVADRANQRHLVVHLRQLGHDLGELNAGQSWWRSA